MEGRWKAEPLRMSQPCPGENDEKVGENDQDIQKADQ